MSKRRRNPVANSYVCSETPHKTCYLKAAHAWAVGAKRIAENGIALWVYRCNRHWHLTSHPEADSIKIDTKAAPSAEVA